MTEERTEEVRINTQVSRDTYLRWARRVPDEFVVSRPLLYYPKRLIKVLATSAHGGPTIDIIAEVHLTPFAAIAIPEAYARHSIQVTYETDITPDDRAIPDCTDMRRDELVSIIAEGIAKGLKMALENTNE